MGVSGPGEGENMSIKRKLILIGICIGIVLVVFTVNVIRRINNGNQGDKDGAVVQENIISRAEAYRLLSYLDYDKANREALSFGITYSDHKMSGWYDTYVNAVWNMGLIEGNVTISPKEALTYGECKRLIDQFIMKYPIFQNVYQGLSFDFVNADKNMLNYEFLELYEAILQLYPEEDRPVKEEVLFVLGREEQEEGKGRMVTDRGKYFYEHTVSYEIPYEKFNSDLVKRYLDKGIHAMVRGSEIIYITSSTTEKMVIRNVWITQGKDKKVETFVCGIEKTFQAKYRLSDEIEKVIGDITIEDQKVIQISVKPDMIKGKVLQSGKDFIEVEGYGKIPLDQDYKIYKIYGQISMESTNSILVGYETTDFVVSGGKISAALIKESIKAENIRVLLKTTDYAEFYHQGVTITSDSDFTISNKENQTAYNAGEIVNITPGDDLLAKGRIKIETTSDDGKIQILSIKRLDGNPKYRGTIEISEDAKGLLIVNELPLEEYLYAVIPSEMPTYYGLEPLKVQAVCARSYAYRHLLANSLNQYGAHVDDSVSYQVYNNISENEESILAVKDTYGQVIEYKGEVITAYYFSTSCGHTTSAEHVWAYGEPIPYLKGKLMTVEDSETVVAQENKRIFQDLSKEKNFRKFISEADYPTYDSEFNWYRWKTTLDIKEIEANIDKKLSYRYNANPKLILTQTKGAADGEEAIFESVPVESIGEIVDISVLKRETGGIITELLITGSKRTVKVLTEYNIRNIMTPTGTVIRNDQSKVDNLGLLPSAFFIIDKTVEDGKLKNITLTGGGYGHGVGMSQNGVKAMSDKGKAYEEIVSFFYEGTKLGFIYE